jgi:hypothetical protein
MEMVQLFCLKTTKVVGEKVDHLPANQAGRIKRKGLWIIQKTLPQQQREE